MQPIRHTHLRFCGWIKCYNNCFFVYNLFTSLALINSTLDIRIIVSETFKLEIL
jgi:hypothetical protein